jgi:glutamate/tyrosine decarboxylase-like PLP-dependent enzyme
MRSLQLSPAEFRRLADAMAALAEQWLAELDERHIKPHAGGVEIGRAFNAPWAERGEGDRALDSLRDVAAHSRAQNGRFFGYILGSAEPAAATADLLASVINQASTAWRSSPTAITIERIVVGWLAKAIGCGGFAGSLCGGGSLANLMGLAMAREAKLPANDTGAQPGVVYASEEIHMSIPKAMALLGLGRQNLRLVPVDSNFRIDVRELARAIEEDRRAGGRAVAIVASAGTVNTGAIDPLEALADIAREHNLWLHVDGAYGALAAIAAPQQFAGLARADSISLDPHKWLYQPLDCGCLLYRDAATARRAFSYSGDYARALEQDPEESFAFFEESIELSRRFRALKLWFSLRYHGLAAFRASISEDLALAQRLARHITAERQLELLAPVDLSAVCFRVRADDAASDALNAGIMQAVNGRGRVYISNATIRGVFALRACITNHRTTEADVDAVVEEVLAAVRQLST